VICVFGKPEYFCKRGWTEVDENSELICPSGQKLCGVGRDAPALYSLAAPSGNDVFLRVIVVSESDEAIQFSFRRAVDCFPERFIGRRFAPTRWLAKTILNPRAR
jgi:hypothetical protein